MRTTSDEEKIVVLKQAIQRGFDSEYNENFDPEDNLNVLITLLKENRIIRRI